MKSRILYILILGSLLSSCSDRGVIPRDTLARIYADIFLADQYIDHNTNLKEQADSLLVYESIFNKYGYNSEDYDQSVKFYLKKSDEFAEVFEDAQHILEARSDVLENILNKDSKIEKFLDSLDIRSSKNVLFNDYFRALNILFFTADTIIVENAPIIDSALIDPIFDVYHLYDALPSTENSFNAVLPVFADTTSIVEIVKDSLGIKSAKNIE